MRPRVSHANFRLRMGAERAAAGRGHSPKKRRRKVSRIGFFPPRFIAKKRSAQIRPKHEGAAFPNGGRPLSRGIRKTTIFDGNPSRAWGPAAAPRECRNGRETSFPSAFFSIEKGENPANPANSILKTAIKTRKSPIRRKWLPGNADPGNPAGSFPRSRGRIFHPAGPPPRPGGLPAASAPDRTARKPPRSGRPERRPSGSLRNRCRSILRRIGADPTTPPDPRERRSLPANRSTPP